MSIQATTGLGSLLPVGLSISDISTLFSLGRRAGNWLTAASGDRDFLQLLDQDELDILRRGGLVDTLRFNKRWGSEMFFLANNKPMAIKGELAENNLEKLGQLTALMVCITAALDAFAHADLVKWIIRKVLSELLRTTEYGEDVLASQCNQRINSWRSSAIVRGLSTETRRIRRDLLRRRVIVDGLMPRGDVHHIVSFLCWLISEKSESYMTPSSDVAGVGWCLSEMGVDVLAVSGLGETQHSGPLRLEYNPDEAKLLPGHSSLPDVAILSRPCLTTVNLQCPEESLTLFPVDAETANRCRAAWTEGRKASRFIACRPVVPSHWGGSGHDDFQYVFYSTGTIGERIRTEIYQLASEHGFVVNRELCHGLEKTFRHESPSTLTWLEDQTCERPIGDAHIASTKMKDAAKVNAFTLLQAFLMGYYYGIFLDLVDTSTLQLQTVDGEWGFRSSAFFSRMRTRYLSPGKLSAPGIRGLPREDVLCILSALLLGKDHYITGHSKDHYNRDNWCVGIISNRALIVNSLIKPCGALKDVGQFVLLDVDVSGIPANVDGIVRPGVSSQQELDFSNIGDNDDGSRRALGGPGPASEPEDATFHIEADWDGDPETVLLCVRYRGRRMQTINPATADASFLNSLVRPATSYSTNSKASSVLKQIQGRVWTVADLFSRNPPLGAGNSPTWQHMPLSGRPRLRYFVSEVYGSNGTVRISRSLSRAAIESCLDALELRHNSFVVIVTGADLNSGDCADEWYPEEIEEKISGSSIQRLGKGKTRVGQFDDIRLLEACGPVGAELHGKTSNADESPSDE